jgi:hypothetical protein
MNSIFHSKILFIITFVFIFIIIFNNNIYAGELEASNYQISLDMNSRENITSENIIIKKNNMLGEIELEENIYLDRFSLVKIGGEKILPENIVVETPFARSTLAEQHRFLIMKKDQTEGWFRIIILSNAVYSSPGEYKADIFINGLDWEISFRVILNPFTKLNIDENKFLISINTPSDSNFHISPELYKLNIDSNNINWKIEAFIEYGGLYDEKGHFLSSENIFYCFENTDYQKGYKVLNQEQFSHFSEKESTTLISGDQYKRGLDSIRFAIFLGEKWSCQAAGLYQGTIIFTIITED